MSQIKFVKTSSAVSVKIANIYDSIGDYSYSDIFDRYANLMLKIAQQEDIDETEDNTEEPLVNEHIEHIVDHPLADEQSSKLKSEISEQDYDLFDEFYNAWSSGNTIKESIQQLYDQVNKPENMRLGNYLRSIVEKVVQTFYKIPDSSLYEFTDQFLKGNLKFAEDELLLSLRYSKPEQIIRYDKQYKIDSAVKYLPDGHAKKLFSEYLYYHANPENIGQIFNDLMNLYDVADYFDNASELESYLKYTTSFDSFMPGNAKEEIVNIKNAGFTFSSKENYYQYQLNIYCSNNKVYYFIKNIQYFRGIQEAVQISDRVFDRLTAHFNPQQIRFIFDNIKSLYQEFTAEDILKLSTLLPFDQAVAKYKELQHDPNELDQYYKNVLGKDYELFELESNKQYQTLYLMLIEADKEKAEIYIGSLSDVLNTYISSSITKSNAKYFLDYITKFDRNYVRQYLKTYNLSTFLKYIPDRLQEIHPIEIWNHNNPDVVLAYHKSNPEFRHLGVEGIIKYSDFYAMHVNAVDIPYQELVPHIKNNNVQNYILFGSTDPNKAVIANKIYKENKYNAKKIASRFTDNDIFDLSNVNKLDIDNPRFEHLSLTELNLLSDKENHFESLERIRLVKESFKNPRTPAYHNIEEGSADYNKLLYILFHNFDLRGRNPQLLIKLLDIHAKDQIIAESNLYQESFMIFNRILCDLDNMDYQDAKKHLAHRKNMFTQIQNKVYTKYGSAIRLQNTEITKYSLDQIYEFAKKYDNAIESEDAEQYLPHGITAYQAGEALEAIDNNFGLLIYLNRESLYKFYQFILDRIIGKSPDYSNSAIQSLPVYAGTFATADIDFYLPDVITEDLIKEISSIQIPNRMNIDFTKTEARLNSNTKLEYVNESMALLRLFNKSLPNFLDKYIIASGRVYDKQMKFAELDDYVQAIIIHSAAQMFDNVEPGPGLSDFIIQQMNNKNIKQICRIAKVWNKEINLADEKMGIASRALTSELAKTYDVGQLYDLIKTSSSLIFFSKIEVKEPRLAKEFDKHFEFSDKPDYNQNLGMDENDRLLKMYQNIEILYKHRSRFPQPDWAEIEEEYHGYTAKFLQRHDTRGMFIGNYAGCCQHPDSYAATLAIDGQISNKSSFFIIEDQRGEMILGSYVWEDDNGNICFDSFETIGSKLFGSDEAQKIVDKLIFDVAKRMNTNVNFGALSSGAYQPKSFKKKASDPFVNNAKPWENVYAKTIFDLNSKEINSERLYVSDSESQIIIIQQ